MNRKASNGVSLSLTSQIVAWAKFQILTGRYRTGERLPAAHELASEFKVNPNTVRAAYARLKDFGWLNIKQGRGAFVQAVVSKEQAHRLRELLDEIFVQARKLQLTPSDVASVVWMGGKLEARSARVWFVDAEHPYFDIFTETLSRWLNSDVNAVYLDKFKTLVSEKSGPEKGDLIFVPAFYFEAVRQLLGDAEVKLFPISARLNPQTISDLAELPSDMQLGVVCLEDRFAKISGKVMQKSGVNLPMIYGNMAESETLSKVFHKADALTISTRALERLRADEAPLPDKPVIPFNYEIDQGSLQAAKALMQHSI